MSAKGNKTQLARELKCIITVANTATTGSGPTQIASGYALNDLVGMRIHRIKYDLMSVLNQLNTSADSVRLGFTFMSVAPTGGFLPSSAGVINMIRVWRNDFGTAANGFFMEEPSMIEDFTMLPGGGKLVHPASLYMYSYTESGALAGSGAAYVTIEYTTEDIDKDLWDDMWKSIFVTQPV